MGFFWMCPHFQLPIFKEGDIYTTAMFNSLNVIGHEALSMFSFTGKSSGQRTVYENRGMRDTMT